MIYKSGYINGKAHLKTYLGSNLVADYTAPEEPETPIYLKDVFPYRKAVSLKDDYAQRTGAFQNAAKNDYDEWALENGMKMKSVMPTEGNFSWAKTDAFLNFCRANGKKAHIHTPHWANVVSEWLRAKEGVWTEAQFKAWLTKYITDYIMHLQPWWDIIVSMDLVNEAFRATRLDESLFWNRVHPDNIATAFSAANKINHGIPMLINEFGLETSDAKPTTIVNYINSLKSRGIIVDGVGSQTHTPANVRLYKSPDAGSVESRFRKITSAGLKFRISEFDVKLKNGVTTSNGWPTNVPGWSTTDKTRAIETTIYKARPDLQQVLSDVYVGYHDLYARVTPPAQRLSFAEFAVGDRDTHLNAPVGGVSNYTDFPTPRLYDYTNKQAYYDLLNMTVPNYTP